MIELGIIFIIVGIVVWVITPRRYWPNRKDPEQ